MAKLEKCVEAYIKCACHSAEHVFEFLAFPPDKHDPYPDAYLSVHLCTHRWYKRVIYAVKYLFGYKSKYGCFDEFIVDKDTAVEFRNALDKFIAEWDRYYRDPPSP